MSSVQILLLSSVVGIVVGVFGLMVAVREWRRGSAWWAWLVPGGFGGLVVLLSLLRLVWVAT